MTSILGDWNLGGGGGHLREKGEGAFSGFFLVRKTKKKRKEKGTRERKTEKESRKRKWGGGAGEGAKSFPIKPTGSRRQRRSISHYSLWVTKIGF